MLFKLVIATILIYSIFLFLIYFFQEKILFKPRTIARDYIFKEENLTEFYLNPCAKVYLHGIQIKKDKNNTKAVFFLHGNSGNMLTTTYLGAIFNQLGYDFYSYDYRSYGKSSGKITSENQLINDTLLVLNWIAKQYKPTHISLIGYSIGTGIATRVAQHLTIARLILCAPYTSLFDLKKERYWDYWLPDFILKYRFNTFQNLETVTAPIILFHGEKDEKIASQHSKILHQKFPHSQLFLIPNQGHLYLLKNPLAQKYLANILKTTA